MDTIISYLQDNINRISAEATFLFYRINVIMIKIRIGGYRMRIAIFTETYFPFISGVVTHIQTLKEGLEAEGHQVLIVTLNPKAKHHYVKDNILYCPAISLKKIYGYGIANPLNLQRLSIVKKFNPDIIHVQTEFTMGIFGLFTADKLKVPVVYTLHTMYDDYVFYLFPEKMGRFAQPAAHAYIRKVASKSTSIIGPSVKVAEYLRRCGVNRHVDIIPNTVDLTAFMAENVDVNKIEKVKKELSINTNDVVLCFVGRLGKEKSIDVLIDYFAKEYLGRGQYKLIIIGDGPEKAVLSEQINRLKVQKQVFLLGRIEHDELPAYYHACDLFSTASLTEMNSISMLEATASGLYTVQRLDVYNRDQIKAGQNGDVFNSPTEFAHIIDEYAKLDSEGRKKRKENVSNFAKRYGQKEFIEAVTNVYVRSIDRYNKSK